MLVSGGKKYCIPDHIKDKSSKKEFKFNINMDNEFIDFIFDNSFEELSNGLLFETIKKLDVFEIKELDKLLNALELREHQLLLANIITINDMLIDKN